MTAGVPDSFVFLLDMNALFESYVAAALEAYFGVPVETQKQLGRLLQTPQGGMAQIADFVWEDNEKTTWIGDAKYKHLAKGQDSPLTFLQDETTPAGRFLNANDIRQLTVYAELYQRKHCGRLPHLMLLYPYVGTAPLKVDGTQTWNDSRLYLVPIRVTRHASLSDLLPQELHTP
jgi:5-methylcytosine-specific restriction endonuclease McrBC regulatory subunit McrC